MLHDQFHDVLDIVLDFLQEDCVQHPEKYRSSGEAFEPNVKEAVDFALAQLHLNAEVDYTPGGHGFPDIVIMDAYGHRYGIEVKSSSGSSNSWKINGNSILGSTRVPDIIENVIVFGKVRGHNSEFRARTYEDCIANVVVTHSPRYYIDLDLEPGQSFFDKSNISYEEISNSNQPIRLITDYFRSIGQTAWWLAESTPAAIRMFSSLSPDEQNKLVGYAMAHFPEIFSSSSTKFTRFSCWLAAENSIIDPSLRDRFTAGGRANLVASGVTYPHLPRILINLHAYRDYVLMELEDADPDVLEADWACCPRNNFADRVRQWIDIVADLSANIAPEGTSMFHLIESILLDPIE